MATNHDCGCIFPRPCCYWTLSCPSPRDPDSPSQLGQRKSPQVVEVQHRRERGLFDYRSCTVKELKPLVKSRGITGLPKRAGKRKLVAALEEADDQAVFFRFMDLPPELRVAIFGLHLRSFTKPAKAAQPPITKVSRLIRQETLPLFYHDMRVHVDLRQMLYLRKKDPVPIVVLHIDRFVKKLSATTLSRFGTIEVDYYDNDTGAYGVWTIDMSSSPNEQQIVHRAGNNTIVGDLAVTIERHLSEFVAELKERPAHQKLHVKDFTAMRDVFEMAVLECWSNSAT